MITSVAVTPDGRLGASGGYEGTARAWNLNERRQIACFSGHRSQRVRAVAIAPDGGRVVSASESSLYDWLLDPRAIAGPFQPHDAADGNLAAVVRSGGISVVDLRTGTTLGSCAPDIGSIRTVEGGPGPACGFTARCDAAAYPLKRTAPSG